MRYPKREERRRFWELVRAGVSRADAAQAAGVNAKTTERWFQQAGGVLPTNVSEPSSGRDPSVSEPEEIFAGLERGESTRPISKLLWPAPSTRLPDLRPHIRHHPHKARARLPTNPHLHT